MNRRRYLSNPKVRAIPFRVCRFLKTSSKTIESKFCNESILSRSFSSFRSWQIWQIASLRWTLFQYCIHQSFWMAIFTELFGDVFNRQDHILHPIIFGDDIIVQREPYSWMSIELEVTKNYSHYGRSSPMDSSKMFDVIFIFLAKIRFS